MSAVRRVVLGSAHGLSGQPLSTQAGRCAVSRNTILSASQRRCISVQALDENKDSMLLVTRGYHRSPG